MLESVGTKPQKRSPAVNDGTKEKKCKSNASRYAVKQRECSHVLGSKRRR